MRFEFVPAFKGDCFLIHAGTPAEPVLVLVDGGPGGTYDQHLRPRLMEIRDERGLDAATPLTIDLVIVSHVDDDHINGLVAMFRELFEAARDGTPPPFEVLGLWHNSFDEIVGNDQASLAAAQFGPASIAPLFDEAESREEADAALILQSIKQGHELRELALSDELQIPINDGFHDGLIRTDAGAVTRRKLGGVTFTIVGPREAELTELQQAHDEWLEERRRAGKPITPGSLLQALTDESVANLSSIVLLADDGTRTALLTGDARSDFILKGLEESGLIAASGRLEVDLLKMPHHGSDRNVNHDFLVRVTAPRYLFSGNGEHGNPERETVEMLVDARPVADMKLYLTYDLATIDAERRRVHEHERAKEVAKKAKGKLRGEPRKPWNTGDHALSALRVDLPPSIRFVEPTGPSIAI